MGMGERFVYGNKLAPTPTLPRVFGRKGGSVKWRILTPYLPGSLATARDADSGSHALRQAAGGFPVIRLNAREKAASES